MNWMNQNLISNVDTDAISICKPDMSEWSKEEQRELLNALNAQFPELIHFDHDGVFSKFLVLKSKNYIMIDEKGKRKIKGSGLKDQKTAKMLSNLKSEIIDCLLNEEPVEKIVDVYHKYVIMTKDIKDIQPWSKKLTVSEKVLNCKGHEKLTKEEKKEEGIRLNETNVYDAIKHTVVQGGDKVWLYYTPDDTLKLSSEFDGLYDRKRLLKNVYTSLGIFKNVLDLSKFIDYSLKKKNKEALEKLDGICC